MAKTDKEQYMVEIFNKHVEKISANLGIPGQKGKFNRGKNRWNFSCPFCKEGKSWGRQARFWYDVTKNYVHCYNGGCRANGLPEHYASMLEKVKEVDIVKEYMTLTEAKDEFKQGKYDSERVMEPINLPDNVISIFEIKDYEPVDSVEAGIILKAKQFLITRKIVDAPFSPDELYIIAKQKVPFFARLIIPFKVGGQIIYWQGRALKETIKPKYLSSENLCRNVNPIYGLDYLPPEPEYVFITEAPIDAMFSINTVAIGHDYPSLDTVEYLIEKFNLNRFALPRAHIVIIVDNPTKDSTGLQNYLRAIDDGLSVFTWLADDNLTEYKDFNEYVVGSGDTLKFTDMDYMKSMIQAGFVAKMLLNPDLIPRYPQLTPQ